MREKIDKIKRFVVTYVEYGDSVDGKARILGVYQTREEARKEMAHAAALYKESLVLDEIRLCDDVASVGDVGECGCEYRIDEVEIPVYAGEIDDRKAHK